MPITDVRKESGRQGRETFSADSPPDSPEARASALLQLYTRQSQEEGLPDPTVAETMMVQGWIMMTGLSEPEARAAFRAFFLRQAVAEIEFGLVSGSGSTRVSTHDSVG